MKIAHGDKCQVCGGEIKASGFMGHLFCWGKCYCYILSQKYKDLLERNLHVKESFRTIINSFVKGAANG